MIQADEVREIPDDDEVTRVGALEGCSVKYYGESYQVSRRLVAGGE